MRFIEEFKEAKELIDKFKYKEAIAILRKILKFDPNYYAVRIELAKLLVREEKTEEEGRIYLEQLLHTNYAGYALLELGKLELMKGNREKAQEDFEKILTFKDKISIYALEQLVYLEIKNKNYNQAYSLFQKILELKEFEEYIYKDKEIVKIEFYLKSKLGLLTEKEKKSKRYFQKQVLNYDEEEAIKHIKLHTHKIDNKIKHTEYIEEINIDNLFNEVKSKIQDEEPKLSVLTDKYIIDCDDTVGIINRVGTNKVEVCTLSNTKDIITMYPVLDTMHHDNYEIDMENVKVKRISQIEKFNLKYNLN